MGLFIIIHVLFVHCCVSVSVWPQPRTMNVDDSVLIPLCNSFSFLSNQTGIPVLEKAFTRYLGYIFGRSRNKRQPLTNCVNGLSVFVVSSSQDSLKDADESYSLNQNRLMAQSFVGVLRGLETFSALVVANEQNVLCVPSLVSIEDAPRFAHRGLMIDSARHFLSVESILAVIDAMSFAKFNVLHWHLTDAESFPICLPSVPALCLGAYNPTAVYQTNDIQRVIEVN